jgi:hydroxymethylglutaryl-CoA synthase
MGEYFSAVVQQNYRNDLKLQEHKKLLSDRQELSFDKYLNFYNFQLPIDGSEFDVPQYRVGKFQLVAIKNHQRIYR